METQARVMCILCLKICDEYKSIEGDVKDGMDVLLPKIDLSAIQGPVVCTHCEETLKKCFDFKVKCLSTQDYLVSFKNNKDSVKLDLTEVYLSKNKGELVPIDQDICGFCMCPAKNCLAVYLDGEDGDVGLKMIKQCFPKLDLSIVKKPVICSPCRGSLENCSRFVTNCLMIEEKVKKYCEIVDINSKGQIELSSLLQFTVRDVTTYEDRENTDGKGLGNKSHILKLEQMFCSDSENAIEAVDLKDNNFVDLDVKRFTAESMPVCADLIKMEGKFCDVNKFEENVEDHKFVLDEEIEIKTEEPDFTRFEDGIILPEPKNNTGLCTMQNSSTSKVEDLLKPCFSHTNYNKNASKFGVFECMYCPFQTKWKNSLKIHGLIHKDPSEVTMYKCDRCPFQSKHKQGLEYHMMTHKDPSEITMFKCESCSFQTKYKRAISVHSQKHKDPSEKTMYKCDFCSYQTNTKNGLKRHLLKHKDPSEVTMYKCDSCSFQSKYKQCIKDHMITHMDLSEVATYKCDFCTFQTKMKAYLRKHLLRHKEPVDVKMYKCDHCSFQTKHKHMGDHMLVHKNPLEVTMYKCYSCSFQTMRRRNMKKHLLKHQDPSAVTTYKCYSCPYQTKDKSCLKNHSLKHKDGSKVKMYKCDSCSFQTKKRYNLAVHSLTHKDPSEITMYKCDSCSYQTRQKAHLKRHFLMHKDVSEVTMFKCHNCSFQSKYKQCIKDHMVTHMDLSEEATYKCDSCTFQTKIKAYLRKHLLRHKEPLDVKK